MKYAYSTLTLKAIDEDKRILRGTATTPTPDRTGDIVEPKGAEFNLPIPFLWQHDSDRPIGHVTQAKVTKDGIDVVVELSMPEEGDPPDIVARLNNAWADIKKKLVRGLSIGFRPKEYNFLEDGSYGMHFVKWLWLELSAVTIAANGDCSITAIKSIDESLRASHGRTQRRCPGASGTTGREANPRTKGNPMKTLKELLDEKAVQVARLDELKAKMADDTATDEENDEADELIEAVKSLDREIRMKRIDVMNASTAKGIDGSSSAAGAASRAARNNPVTKNEDKDDEFAGQSFARIVKAKAVAWKHGMPLSSVAENMYGKTAPGLVRYIKAGVPGGGTGSGEWGAELVGIDNRYTGDFIDYLYGMTGFDKLGLREAPRNVAVKGMDGAATANWVGESKSIPVSAPSASTADLVAYKLAGMCVMSNELLADSSPGAELLVRDALAEAIAFKLDTTFFSAVAASAGVSPAGILNGLTQIATTGTDAAALRAFINAAYSGFITAKNSTGLVLVMSPGTAKALGLLVNALGQSEFSGLGTAGGTLLGDRVVVSDNIDPSQIILLKPSDIWRIGDRGVDIALSNSAMVEQDTAPTGASDTPVAASATMMSMFGTDSTAIRAIRRVGWKLRRTGVVAFTDTADYNGISS